MIFLVEDGPHRSLLCSLGIGRKSILVMGSKGDVIRRLKDRPADVGIVDEDPDSIQAQPRELMNYQEVKRSEGLCILIRRGSGGQRLIVFCPGVEGWLLHRARTCGIDPRQYQLPGTPKELHAMPRYEQKHGFQRLLAQLNGLDKGMSLLRQWVFQGA
jgi:hypothetical protein